METPVGDVGDGGGLPIDLDDQGPVSLGRERKFSGGVDRAGGADGEKDITTLGALDGEVECIGGKGFTKPNDVRTQGAAAIWTGRRGGLGGDLLNGSSFPGAKRSVKVAVKFNHRGCPGDLMESVDVLGDELMPGEALEDLVQGHMTGVGWTSVTNCRRHAYHSQTRRGLDSNASGVANSVGAYWAQRPVCASRNVGTPLSAEMPAPVRATADRHGDRDWTRASGMDGFDSGFMNASKTWPAWAESV